MVVIFFVQLNNANTLLFNKILERLFCSKINWSGLKDINYETFIKTAASTNRDMSGNRDLLKVVRERTQSLLRSCYHTFSKSLLGSVKGVRLEAILD